MARTAIHDAELTGSAFRIFCELALWLKNGETTATRGHRAIATALNLNRETVAIGLRQLEERGHIRIHGEGQQRRTYELLNVAYLVKEKQKYARELAA